MQLTLTITHPTINPQVTGKEANLRWRTNLLYCVEENLQPSSDRDFTIKRELWCKTQFDRVRDWVPPEVDSAVFTHV